VVAMIGEQPVFVLSVAHAGRACSAREYRGSHRPSMARFRPGARRDQRHVARSAVQPARRGRVARGDAARTGPPGVALLCRQAAPHMRPDRPTCGAAIPRRSRGGQPRRAGHRRPLTASPRRVRPRPWRIPPGTAHPPIRPRAAS
jgi:hypothetical protein